jgi:cbb3-type cytochrome oxidase maturation protein
MRRRGSSAKEHEAISMSQVIVLIPIALFLGLLGLVAFVWSIKTGQYDDLQGAAERILDDGDDRPADRRDAPERAAARR